MPTLADFDPSKIKRVAPSEPKALTLDELDPSKVVRKLAPSKLESSIRGAAQMGSYGFADELAGGAEALKEKLLEGKDFTDSYKKHRDESRKAYKIAEETNPKSYLGGELAGGVASAFIPGLGFLNAGKAATVGGAALKGLAAGAAGGALSSAGSSEADLGTGQFAADVGKGAALGGALGGAFGAAGNYLTRPGVQTVEKVLPEAQVSVTQQGAKAAGALDNAVPVYSETLPEQVVLRDVEGPSRLDKINEYLQEKFGGAADALKGKAEIRAAKSGTGQNSKALRQMSRGDIENLRDTGRTMLDKKITKFGSSISGIGKRAKAASKEAGQEIGDIRSSLDKYVSNPVKGQDISDDILSYAMETYHPNYEDRAANLVKQSRAFDEMGDLSFADAQRLKSGYAWDQNQVSARGNVSSEDIEKKLNSLVEKHVEKAVDRVGGENPDLAGIYDKYKGAKKTFSTLEPVAKAAKEREIKNLSNNTFSPSDKAAGLAYLVSKGFSNPLDLAKAVAVGGANKLVRGRFDSTAAVLGDKVANVLSAAPERLGKYANVLAEAAQKGPQAAAAVHMVLMQRDPEYRKQIEDIEAQP